MSQTLREVVLNTFAGQEIDRIALSPRFHYWYRGNNVGNLPKKLEECHAPVPEEFWGKRIMEIFDILGASPRYPSENANLTIFHQRYTEGSDIKVTRYMDKELVNIIQLVKTPVGKLKGKLRPGPPGAGEYEIERPIKKIED